MDALTRPIVPPAPRVHARELPAWRLIWLVGRNNLGFWAEHHFQDLFSRRRVFGIEFVLVSEPEGIRHVLTAAARSYRRPVLMLRVTRPLTGTGVLLAEGDEWRRQRRMLAPLFSPSRIGILLPHFMGAAEAMIQRLDSTPRVNLAATFHDTAFHAVMRALFSLADTGESGGFAATVRSYVAGPGRPNLFDGLAKREEDFSFATRRRERFREARMAAAAALIEARRRNPNTCGYADLLDLLLAARDPETGTALTDAEIGEQVTTMLVAGFETTSRLLFWATYLLALDRMEQSQIRQEVEHFPPDRVSGLEDLQHWPRLRQTLLEALRLYPPVPIILREAISDDMILNEPVKAGTQVWISPWVMHRHRKFWDQPTAFMPERFAGNASPWTSGGPFLPFGGGPRVCIGASFAMAEAQIVLATLLSRFEVVLDDDRTVLPVASTTTVSNVEPWFRLDRVTKKRLC